MKKRDKLEATLKAFGVAFLGLFYAYVSGLGGYFFMWEITNNLFLALLGSSGVSAVVYVWALTAFGVLNE